MFGWLTRLFRRRRFDREELARRLGLPLGELERTPIEYRALTIPKRSGGTRTLAIPGPALKTLQRKLLRRVLGKLRSHPAAYGFERGRSIVDHAGKHADSDVVMRFDLRDFFQSTPAARIEAYFRRIGWDESAAALLTKLCTWQGSLPQGAPTSPRLSNLVNFGFDARLTAAAKRCGAAYSRYADDLAFSFDDVDDGSVATVISRVRRIVRDAGYCLNRDKTRVMRRHQRQQITGLVVNAGVNLPRETRRRLRAIEHRRRQGQDATLTDAQLAGWRAFRAMLDRD